MHKFLFCRRQLSLESSSCVDLEMYQNVESLFYLRIFVLAKLHIVFSSSRISNYGFLVTFHIHLLSSRTQTQSGRGHPSVFSPQPHFSFVLHHNHAIPSIRLTQCAESREKKKIIIYFRVAREQNVFDLILM